MRENPAPAPARAYFVALDSTTPRGPQFAPALQCLRTALMRRGLAEVNRREEAAIVISLGYEVTRAGTEIRHSTRSVDVTRVPSPQIVSGTGRRIDPPPPTRDVLLVQQKEERYRIVMQIDARDARTDRALWRIETSALIGPNDRNAILPCMIAAAEPVLDPTENSAVEVAVRQDSPEVRSLRGGS